jgi:hypothetical protein
LVVLLFCDSYRLFTDFNMPYWLKNRELVLTDRSALTFSFGITFLRGLSLDI